MNHLSLPRAPVVRSVELQHAPPPQWHGIVGDPRHTPFFIPDKRTNGSRSGKLINAHTVDEALARHFQSHSDVSRPEHLARRFRREKFVQITRFLPPELHALTDAVSRAHLDENGFDRAAPNPHTGTPRNLRSVDRDGLMRELDVANAIARSRALRALLEQIVGEPVRDVDRLRADDRYVLNEMRGKGDELGFHIDPARLALVIILKAPIRRAGGHVEFCRLPPEEYAADGSLNAREVRGIVARNLRSVVRKAPPTNSAYLLEAAALPHRVGPFRHSAERRSLTISKETPGSERRSPETIAATHADEVAYAYTLAGRSSNLP